MPETNATRLKAVITGRVQRVGFRAFVESHARSLFIVGRAANRPDGSVEVVAEGPRESLETFLDRLRHGPSLARVENVAVEWSDATGEFRSFTSG